MPTLDAVFGWLLRASWQASVLVGLVLLAQWIFRQHLSPAWRHALWLLVLARLLIPVTPESPVSLFNLTRLASFVSLAANGSPASAKTPATAPATPAAVATSGAPRPSTAAAPSAATPRLAPREATSREPSRTATSLRTALPVVWLAGVSGLLLRMVWQNARFSRRVLRRRQVTDTTALEALEDCRQSMGLRTPLTVIETSEVKSPALYGFIRPRLVLPQGTLAAFSREELHYIFLHELAHVKRSDMAVNWLINGLCALHWFNPILWFGFQRMAADREVAADALALTHAPGAGRQVYGQTIIKLLESFTRPAVLPGLVGILEDKSQMQRRIIMIAQFKPMARWSTTAAGLLLVLGTLTLTDAQTEPPTYTPPAPGMTARLVFANKEGFYGVSSPVGNCLYRMNWGTGDVDVFDVKSGQTRRIANLGLRDSAVDFTEFQVCSRDGQQIAFDTHTDDMIAHLRIRNMDGSGNRVLYSGSERGDRVYPLNWSPDGQSILAVRTTQDKKHLVLTSTADGTMRTLHSAPSLHGWIGACFSPDGRFIAIDLETPGDPSQVDVHVMTSDGRDVVAVAGHPAYDHVLGWSPDGQKLVFASWRSGTNDIWIVPVAEGKQRGAPVLLKKGFDDKAIVLGLTTDGSLCYWHRVWLGQLYHGELDLETGKVLVPPTPVPTQYTGALGFVQWSPDGKNLLYVSQVGPGSSGNNLLTIRSADMGKERFLSPSVRGIIQTSWTADSRSIVGFKIGAKGIFKIDAETSEVTQLSKNGFRARLCPDGKTLLFSWSTGIFRRDLASGEEAAIVTATKNLPYTLSPDGRQIAFAVDGVLKIVSIAGGEPRELSRELAGIWALNWTEDGRHIIAWAGGASRQSEIWRIPVERGIPLKLDLSVTQMTSFSLHPDNRRFAFSAVDENNRTELWVLENFLPKATLAAK